MVLSISLGRIDHQVDGSVTPELVCVRKLQYCRMGEINKGGKEGKAEQRGSASQTGITWHRIEQKSCVSRTL